MSEQEMINTLESLQKYFLERKKYNIEIIKTNIIKIRFYNNNFLYKLFYYKLIKIYLYDIKQTYKFFKIWHECYILVKNAIFNIKDNPNNLKTIVHNLSIDLRYALGTNKLK